jgi:hypothetical protein
MPDRRSRKWHSFYTRRNCETNPKPPALSRPSGEEAALAVCENCQRTLSRGNSGDRIQTSIRRKSLGIQSLQRFTKRTHARGDFRIRVPRRSQQNGFLRNEANQLSRFICRGRTEIRAPMKITKRTHSLRSPGIPGDFYTGTRNGGPLNPVFRFYETNPFAALCAFAVQRGKLPNEPICEIRGPKHPKSERSPKSEGRTDSPRPIRFYQTKPMLDTPKFHLRNPRNARLKPDLGFLRNEPMRLARWITVSGFGRTIQTPRPPP